MKKRNDRHEYIRKVIRDKHIRTQRALVDELLQAGFKCTQATVSRDITDLGLQKINEGYYVLSEDIHLQRMVKDLVEEVRMTGNLVLVKASPGTAPGIAAALDGSELPQVVGSVAGDDTVLVICDNEEDAESFRKEIEKLRQK